MDIRYNVKGTERKRLAETIASFLGGNCKYQGPPTFAYKAGEAIIGVDGTVSFPRSLVENGLDALLQKLDAEGFKTLEPQEDTKAAPDTPALTIHMPADKVNLLNLTEMLKAKESLIKKALGVDDLTVIEEAEDISFPWFKTMPSSDECKAYTDFIAKLCKRSTDLKRTGSRERPTPNERYAMRCFLIALGFIGPEYKDERKILLKNLSGCASYRDGVPERSGE